MGNHHPPHQNTYGVSTTLRMSLLSAFSVAILLLLLVQFSVPFGITVNNNNNNNNQIDNQPSASLHGSSNGKLVAYPNTIPTQASNITIEWKGIEGATSLDWIGVFAPIDSYRVYSSNWVNASSSSWTTGEGTLTSLLFNMRQVWTTPLY